MDPGAVAAAEHRLQNRRPVGGRAVRKVGIGEQTSRHPAMDLGVLAQVESGQMETEGPDPPLEPPNQTESGVNAAVALEAGGDDVEVVEHGARIVIGVVLVRERVAEPLPDHRQQGAVRHFAVATRHPVGDLGHLLAVRVAACDHLLVDAGA